MLLLGPGEAGKSTVLKQLKCIYKGGIPLAEQRVRQRSNKKNIVHNPASPHLYCLLRIAQLATLLLLLAAAAAAAAVAIVTTNRYGHADNNYRVCFGVKEISK